MSDISSDTRSVIKNATQGGITRPDPLGNLRKSSGATGKGNTIATKEEITTQKTDKNLNPKPIKQTSTNTNTATKKTSTKSPIDMVADSVNSVAKKDNGAIIPSNQQNVGTFQNSTIQPIENIKVSQMDGEQTATQGKDTKTQDDNFINGIGRAKDLKTPIDVDGVIGDLYLDVKAKVKNGTLSSSNLEKMKQVYPELAGLGDDVILSLLGDMGSMVKKGLTLNDTNMEKLKKLYPELRSVAWGFVPPEQQNMYQAGGIKEAMVTASPIDLNQYGTVGAIGEGVLNPIGEGTTLTDAAAQTIPQVDSNTEFTGTPALKKRLQQLTDKDIAEYYKRYQNFQKEHPTLSKGYTTWLPGDTVVEQLWNWVTGKGEQRADAGFRSWLIDQVNNEVNGWKGEFFGAGNDLKDIGGPNIAKMYANLPASAIKTVTAIARAITNPVDTGYGLGVLIKDGYENAVNGTFSQSIIGQRYGSWDAFAKAMEQDPVGVASDLLAVAELGAGTAGTVTKAARWGTRGAALTTYAMGVEKTSQNLFKISNRLKQFEGNLKTFGKNVGGASDMGMREVFGKVSGGLEKWAAEGDGFSNKAAKYLANHMTIKPGLNAAKNILNPTKAIAEGITGTKDAEGKLLQAANPNTNRLANDVNYRDKKKNMDTATRAIVEEGYTPKTIEEWANAHLETLNKKWKQFTNLIKEKADVTINASDLVADVKNWLAKEKEGATVNQRGDIIALEKEIADLENRGQLSMEFLENRKEHYNSSWKDAEKTKKGDIYEKGVKMLGNAIRKQQDNILGKGPEETKALRNQIKALMDTKEDVQKASLKQQKRKEGGGLVENYSRISGLGDIIGGAFNTITGKGGEGISQMGKGLGKLVLGKALGKAKDVDFLTEKGFEGLRKKTEAKNKAKGGDNSKKEGVKFKKDTENIKKKAEVDEEQDYADALNAAYRKNKKGERVSTENKEFTISEDSKVYKDIAPKAKNVGFVTRIVDNMKKALEQAGEGDVEGVRAFTDFRQKLINLSKNPGDTTLQHEFFHSVMKVLDPNTRNLILNQAKQFLSAELGRKVGDIAVEEWLAESFGVYIRDKMIDLGIIERAKGIEGLKQRINRFYQRAYEFMQNYNIDRYTLNDVFNEIYNGNYKLNDKGVLDLSYLWKKGGDNGGLGKKRTLGGGNGGGVKFKKDTGATRYKADINGKSVQIDTKATSPDQLIEKNADGLSIMKAFISDKQAEKALNVAPELLTKDGDAYLWTHTNKYDATPFTAFENAKDSKYKEFTDNQIAWFTNSKEMSNSYASEETKLADTKAPRTDAEFKKYLDSLGKKDGGKNYTTEVEFSVKKGDDGYYVERLDKWDNTYDDEGFREYAAFYGGMTRGAYDVLEKAVGGIDGMMDAFKQKMEGNRYKNVVVERKDGKIHVHTELPSKDTLEYKDKQGLYAGMYAELQGYDKYHYQGIIQDMKNPLVVDLGKYAKGEIRFGEKVEGQGRFWSDLGTAYDFIKKNTDADIDTVAKTIKDEFKKAVDNEDKIRNPELLNDFQHERFPVVMEWKRLEKEGDYAAAKPMSEWLTNLSNAEHKVENLRYGIVEKLTPEEASIKIGDRTVRDIYNKSKKAYEKYKEIYDLWKEQEQTYRKDYPIGGGVVSDKYTRHTRNNFINYLKNKGIDEGAVSMILHDTPLRLDKGWLASYDLAEMLKNKKLQTNDYVFYALRKGGYDGVVFKDIVDYGHLSEERKGGDVVAAFNSKQFKSWDNANPTDSKYISYKKDVGLSKKNDNSEGIKYKRGYHGTSALFNKFDSSHMGEGEGAQAHGWGHYIAVNRKTGEYYAQGKGEYTYDWDKAKDKGWKTEVMVNRIIDDINNYGGTPKEAIEATRKGYEAQMKGAPEALQKSIQADLDTLNKIDADNFSYNGNSHLYEIDVPDPIKKDTPTGKNYWEEGGTITNKQFSKIADKLKEKYPYQFNNPNGWNDDYLFGQFLNYRQGGFSEKMNGRQIYNMISEIVGSDKEASKFLESLGYDGIHYYGGRDGEAYVIFGDDTPQITKRLYKKDVGLKAKNGYKIDENAKTPEQLVKDVNGASEMVSFISEKQAKMAHDVSKDLLSKDGNPYMWMHTNKYNDKMFSDFKATRDSKYSLYTSKDIAWFSNSNNITQSYAEGKSKLAPTKRFNSIEEFNKYADKNVLDDGWKIQRYGDEKEITKSQIAEWNGKYVPHTISTYENKFDTLADAYAHFNDDGLMKNRGISTKIGELPADPKEAVAKLEKYIKAKEGGDIKIKGNAEKLSSKIDIETKFDNYNTLGYFDNKNDALAEAYQKATPSDYYTYKGIITNMKKPYVVDYSDYKFGKYWNKLGTLTDFAKREGGEKIAKAIDYVNHYDNLKYDLIDFLENGKKDLLGDDGKYIEGNMIEDKDYFLTNIIRNIREGTVDTLLSDGAWKGDEFANIKDDIVHGTKTYGDLYDMLQHLKGNTGLGFMEDYGTLPEVLDKLGVSEGVKNTLIQKLIDREYFDGAPLSYGDRIEIKGIRDLIKKLGGINLETNDYVKYAINNGDYDGVVFKNIIDYGGTPKEGWDKAEPGDVAVTFNSKQFKSWDNADPTESRYISYKKDTKGLARKDTSSDGKKLSEGQMEYFKDSKVRDAQGRLTPVYHFTADDFNTVDFKKGSQNLFWFTSDGTASDRAQGVRPGMQRKRKDMYVDIKNPAGWEEYNKFGTDELKYRGYDGVILKNKDGSFEGFIFDKENQVKYTDNLNPTSSKDMRFKKDMGLKVKSQQTNTPEFKKWFAGSKVIKADGKPQVVYHGTNADFNVFNKVGGPGIYGDGYYFTDKIGTARNYGADGGKVMKVYLDIKNPYEATMKDQYGLSVKKLKEQGYDGVKAKLGNETYWVAFDSNQIKSATDNIGTFDKDNPDIRYKRARHGSPADFEKFDSSHMGEGEGAQAHGWGHYVAVDEQTGRHYAEMGNRNPKVRFEGKEMYKLRGEIMGEPIRRREPKQQVAFEIMERMELGYEGFDDAVATVKRWTEADIRSFEDDYKETKSKFDKESLDAAKKRLEVINDITRDDFELLEGNRRNLYELEIPDPKEVDTPTYSNYLEEEGELPIGAKDNFAIAVADKYGDDAYYKFLKNMKDWGRKDGEGVYYSLSKTLGSDKAASKFLEELGYDGIHYNGKQDGEAYVIFNDDAIKINDHIRYKKDEITPRDLGLGKKSGNEMSNGYNMVTKGGKPYTKATVEGLGLPHFLQKDADGKPFMMFNGSPVYPAQGEYIAGGFRGGKGFKDIYTNEYIFDKNPAYQTYEDNFNQIVANANDTAFTNNTQLLIGKSELGKDIYFTKDALKHILKDHGVFNINNLLETVNNPDYTGVEKPRVGQNGGSAGDRSFFLKEIPGTDNFFLLGIEPSGNGYNVTSFYEITSDDALSHFRMQKASSNETKFKKNVGTNGMKNNQSAANISKGNRYGLVKKIGVRAEENK